MGFKYKKNSQLKTKEEISLTWAKQMPSKVLFVGKKMWRQFGHLHAKLVIVGSN